MKTLSYTQISSLQASLNRLLLVSIIVFTGLASALGQSNSTTENVYTVNSDFDTYNGKLKLGAWADGVAGQECSVSLQNTDGDLWVYYYNQPDQENRKILDLLKDGRLGVGGGTLYAKSLIHLDSRSINNLYPDNTADFFDRDLYNRVRFTNITTGSGVTDGFAIGITKDGTGVLEQNEDKNIELFTNNTRRMAINNSGQVVIGNPSPDSIAAHAGSKLIVDGEITVLANCASPQDATSFKMCFNNNGDAQMRIAEDRNFEIMMGFERYFSINTGGQATFGDPFSAIPHPDARLTVDGAVFISPEGGSMTDISDIEINDDHLLVDTFLLWVDGGIVSEELALSNAKDWADFVFEEDYQLPSLESVEAHIKAKGHLPNIPSAAEVKEGYNLHDMNKRLLQTIEELTLHTIEQDKQQKALLERIEELERLAKTRN
jgi:hypothetical protein